MNCLTMHSFHIQLHIQCVKSELLGAAAARCSSQANEPKQCVFLSHTFSHTSNKEVPVYLSDWSHLSVISPLINCSPARIITLVWKRVSGTRIIREHVQTDANAHEHTHGHSRPEMHLTNILYIYYTIYTISLLIIILSWCLKQRHSIILTFGSGPQTHT